MLNRQTQTVAGLSYDFCSPLIACETKDWISTNKGDFRNCASSGGWHVLARELYFIVTKGTSSHSKLVVRALHIVLVYVNNCEMYVSFDLGKRHGLASTVCSHVYMQQS